MPFANAGYSKAQIDALLAAKAAAAALNSHTSDTNNPHAVTPAQIGAAATSHTQAASTISDSTTAGRALLTAADAAAQRTALSLVVGTDVQAYDSDLAAIAALTTTTYGRALLALADAAALRAAAGLVVGTDVQAYDSDLAAIAALTTTTFGRSLLALADAAAARTALAVGPLNAPDPTFHGLLSWSFDPTLFIGATILTAGVLQLVRVPVPYATTVNNIWLEVQTAGATLTSGQNFVGLYDTSGNRLGVSADLTTAWGSTGLKTHALTSGVALSAGSVIIAMLSNGTTPPTLRRGGNVTNLVNANLSGATLRYSTILTGQTSLPSSLTLSGAAASSLTAWAALN